MLRVVGYWRLPKVTPLVGPEEDFDGFLERHSAVRLFGKFVEPKRTGSPVQLLKCIEEALVSSSTIVFPIGDDALATKRSRQAILNARIPITSLDRAFINLEQFEEKVDSREYASNLMSEKAKAALKQRQRNGQSVGNPKISKVAHLGSKTASEIASLKRQQVAREITSILNRLGSGLSLAKIATELNRLNVNTLRGGSTWHASSVRRIMQDHFPDEL